MRNLDFDFQNIDNTTTRKYSRLYKIIPNVVLSHLNGLWKWSAWCFFHLDTGIWNSRYDTQRRLEVKMEGRNYRFFEQATPLKNPSHNLQISKQEILYHIEFVDLSVNWIITIQFVCHFWSNGRIQTIFSDLQLRLTRRSECYSSVYINRSIVWEVHPAIKTASRFGQHDGLQGITKSSRRVSTIVSSFR